MDKISIEEFRRIKQQMIDLLNDYSKKKNPTKEYEEKIVFQYISIQEQLLSYDLSEIPFEEWKDLIILSTDEYHVDMSKTHANIDFLLVQDSGNVDYHGCHIRNLEKIGIIRPEIFDEETIEENSDLFLSDEFDDDFKKAYYTNSLDIIHFASLSSKQLEELKGKHVENHLSYSFKSRNIFDLLGFDKAIQFYQYSKEEYECVDRLLGNTTQRIASKGPIGGRRNRTPVPDDELESLLADTAVTEIKKICFSNYRNRIINMWPIYIDSYPEMFVMENKDLFLIDVDIPEDVKERYFKRSLSLHDVVTYFDNFKGLSFKNRLESNVRESIFFEEETLKMLISKYPEVFTHLDNADHYYNSYFYSIFAMMERNSKKDDVDLEKLFLVELGKTTIHLFKESIRGEKEIPEWLQSVGYEVVEKIETIEDLLKCTERTIILDDNQRKLITSFGADNIREFEEETGFFSRLFASSKFTSFVNIAVNNYHIKDSLYSFYDGQLDYAEFTDTFAELLDTIRSNNLLFSIGNYDWMQGEFRKSHPRIFMDQNAPKELKMKFYSKNITPNDIKMHPEYIPYLLDKDLSKSLLLDIRLFAPTPWNQNNNSMTHYDITWKHYYDYDFISEYTKRYGNEAFIQLMLKYDGYLSKLHIDSFNGEIDNQATIEQAFRKAIAIRLPTIDTDYSNLGDITEFRDEYPELFIDLSNYSIPSSDKEKIIYDFYRGIMSFEVFRKYPELKKEFMTKFLSMGFRNNNHEDKISRKGPDDHKTTPCITLGISTEEFYSIFGLKDEYLLDLAVKYGENLDYIFNEFNRQLKESEEEVTMEYAESLAEKMIVHDMTIGQINYNEESVPSYFKEKYPLLFLDEKIDSSIKEKFYSKAMDPEEIISNFNEYIDMFGETSITAGLPKKYNWISLLFPNTEMANLYRLKILIEYRNIENDDELAFEFKDYLINNYTEVKKDNIEVIGRIIRRLSTTNSTSLHSVRSTLLKQLLQLDSPMESYEKIERIFLKNNLPLFGKMYYCFEILYPNFSKTYGSRDVFDFSDESRLSPELKTSSLGKVKRYDGNQSDTDKRFQIVFNDLIRIAVKSNSPDLRRYLDNLEHGQDLYYQLLDSGSSLDTLSEDELETLSVFEMHLEMIYSSSKRGKEETLELDDLTLLERIKLLENKIGPTRRYDLKDRIVRMFAYSAGYRSYQELRDDMEKSVREAHERGIRYASELERTPFTLEDGDFLRCIGNYQALGGSLEMGNLSKEFLSTIRGTSGSDSTPLDIDWTLVKKRGDIYHSVEGTPTGFGFGNVYIVMKKDNPNLHITRDKDGNLTGSDYDPKKIEMFGTKVGDDGYETHWGSRTGIALTDVDYILYKRKEEIDSSNPYLEDGTVNYIDKDNNKDNDYNDLLPIKFEIARHGFFIPIVDFAGRSLFSVEEYEMLRKQMMGLSHYGENNYVFSSNLDIPKLNVSDKEYPAVDEIVQKIEESDAETFRKREMVLDVINVVFKKHNLDMKRFMDGDLTPGSVEVIDTGSTGRSTNELGAGDFDLLLRLDSDIYDNEKNKNEFINDIVAVLNQFEIAEKTRTGRGDIRYKGVNLGNGVIVDIDISFDRKTDKIEYTTDECIRDRLQTLKKLDYEKYQKTIANIILAKKVLKDAGVYKSKNSGTPQGGLGGVGVENWILQHGGSFIDAARSFVEAAEGKSFSEFQEVYSVWDFGENHTAERKQHYFHDNFITDNMDAIGYNKMVSILKEYLKQYDLNCIIEDSTEKKDNQEESLMI